MFKKNDGNVSTLFLKRTVHIEQIRGGLNVNLIAT